VDEHAMAAAGDFGFDFLREAREPSAHDLVIVASERVARDVAQARVFQDIGRAARLWRQVIHSRGDDAERTRNELVRSRTAQTMPLHVFHLSVTTLLEPAGQSS